MKRDEKKQYEEDIVRELDDAHVSTANEFGSLIITV